MATEMNVARWLVFQMNGARPIKRLNGDFDVISKSDKSESDECVLFHLTSP